MKINSIKQLLAPTIFAITMCFIITSCGGEGNGGVHNDKRSTAPTDNANTSNSAPSYADSSKTRSDSSIHNEGIDGKDSTRR